MTGPSLVASFFRPWVSVLSLAQPTFRPRIYNLEGPYIYIYITTRELGPKIPYYRRNYGYQFPNGCICGPSGQTTNIADFGLMRALAM